MQTIPSSLTTFTAAVLFAAAAHGQSCLWTYPAPQPQAYGVAVYHSGLQRVLFLATSGNGLSAVQTWAWDGAAWTLLNSNGPSARSGPGVAYDSARDRVVLFGGEEASSGTPNLSDTWEWDRTTWTRSSAAGPSGRASCMTYDESRRRTVLFGGSAYSGSAGYSYFGDTWEWDGQTWTPAATNGPSPRTTILAYDSLRARTMLFGGLGSSYFNDLWEWDGIAWTQRTTEAPSTQPTWMVFDPARARMIVGRWTGTGASETWELDPITALWTIRDPGIAPIGPAAFDVARAVAVALRPQGSLSWTMEYHGSGTLTTPYISEPPTGGTYTVGSAIALHVGAGGSAPLSFQWRHNGQPLIDGGNISGATTDTLTINPAGYPDAGSYAVVVSNPCSEATGFPNANIEIVPVCYANCDNSTLPPFLNVNDFVCFLNKFAAGDSYANCDHNGGPPVLNVLDFACFINRFAAGCSGP